jgi:hypothetical protein
VSETFYISLDFQLSMAVPADRTPEVFVQSLGDRMLHFKAEDIGLWAVEAPGGIAHLLSA